VNGGEGKRGQKVVGMNQRKKRESIRSQGIFKTDESCRPTKGKITMGGAETEKSNRGLSFRYQAGPRQTHPFIPGSYNKNKRGEQAMPKNDSEREKKY